MSVLGAANSVDVPKAQNGVESGECGRPNSTVRSDWTEPQPVGHFHTIL